MLEELIAPKPCAEKEDRELQPLRVCFVCTGNTCRSPMAAAVANAMAMDELSVLPESLRELALPSLVAYSAGLSPQPGDPISPQAVLALEAAGVPAVAGLDYHDHLSQGLSVEAAESYDLLVGLTRRHAMALLMQFPHLAGRILAFPQEISDPWGGDLATYTVCLGEITEGVKALFFSKGDRPHGI